MTANKYKFKEWNNLLTNKDLELISFCDELVKSDSGYKKELKILFEENNGTQYEVFFKGGVEAYRNMDEGAHMDMWAEKERAPFSLSNTFILLDSPLRKHCPWYFEGALHYVITTDSDVLDLISSSAPEFRVLDK